MKHKLLGYKLLLKNPILDNYPTTTDNTDLSEQLLGVPLCLPKTFAQPFIFSCFALSVDGKLCYPDNPSGFSIAKANHHATPEERKADWQTLMLARSISDALIIGSNSLNLEQGNYTPEINIPELETMRAAKKEALWTIIICRTLNKLDFSHLLLKDNKYPVMICCLEKPGGIIPNFTGLKISNLKSRDQLGVKNIIGIDTDIKMMFQIFKDLGFNVILNESPFFHHKLLEEKLLNEIWLNYSCSYIGGSITSLGDKQSSFTSKAHPDTEILTLHHIGYHFLYSRQKINYNCCD